MKAEELNTLTTEVKRFLSQKYGDFPLRETRERHAQRELFSQKIAPKKWRKKK